MRIVGIAGTEILHGYGGAIFSARSKNKNGRRCPKPVFFQSDAIGEAWHQQ
jgi:hypothetical protein